MKEGRLVKTTTGRNHFSADAPPSLFGDSQSWRSIGIETSRQESRSRLCQSDDDHRDIREGVERRLSSSIYTRLTIPLYV